VYELENAECTFHGSALRTTCLELDLNSRTTWYAARSKIHLLVWIWSDSVTCQSVMRAIIPLVKLSPKMLPELKLKCCLGFGLICDILFLPDVFLLIYLVILFHVYT